MINSSTVYKNIGDTRGPKLMSKTAKENIPFDSLHFERKHNTVVAKQDT